MVSHRKIWIAVGILILLAPAAEAQNLFGNRTLGRGLSRRTSPGSEFNLGGAPDAGRRFLRDERTVNDFVGTNSADAGTTGFVGGISAANSAVSSVTGLTEQIRVPINRPKVNRPQGLYAERLSLSPELESESALIEQNQVVPRVSEGLQRLMNVYGVTIEVYPATHSAILRGSVPSERDRETFYLLATLEPGIETIQNDLQVDPGLQSRPLVVPRQSNSVPGRVSPLPSR